MSEGVTGELGLPPIDQVGYAVKDLDRAIERFEPLFGPFSRMEIDLEGTLYRGRKSDVSLKLGFGRSGGIEIELIEVVSGETPHTEFLEKYGNDGPHHVRCVVPELDPVLEKAVQHGFESIWSHGTPGMMRFVYLERDGTILELIESSTPIEVPAS